MEQESEAKVEQKPEQATKVQNDVDNEMKAKDLEKTDECFLEALVEEQLLKATNKKDEQDMIIALELENIIKEKEYKEMQEFIATKKVNNVYSLKQSENEYKIEENKKEERQKEETKQYKEVLDEQELKIQNEPIYENISTASITNVEAEAKIIPNNKKNNPNNIQNQTTYNNHEENNKSHNINLVDLEIEQETQLLTVTTAAQFPTTTAPPQPLPQPPTALEDEPYYQVPKCNESYYDAPKHLRPIPLYENIDIFYSSIESATLSSIAGATFKLEPPKEKPPPPPIASPTPSFEGTGGDDVDGDSLTHGDADNWSSDNTYETITNRRSVALLAPPNPSPPIKRMNSTKRIKKELRHKRSSFLGIESGDAHDDDVELESYLELTVAPPPDMAQLLQEERRLEKQLYLKAGLCDSSDTGESRDSGVSENHSRQSSEPYTNSSEEMEACGDESVSPATPLSLNTSPDTSHVYQPLQTPLLQTVKGNCAASWTESATAAAAASKSLTEATATANAKMLCIEEKIREQEEVLRVERELLQLEQEELKRQRENLQLRENLARRELQHGAKMLMSANRRSLQDLNDEGAAIVGYQQQPLQQQQLPPQQIYANVPNTQQQDYYRRVDSDYRKSMSDLNEFSKRLSAAPLPPTKPMRALQLSGTQQQPMHDDYARRQSFGGGSLVKIAAPATSHTLVQHQQSASDAFYSNYQAHHKSAQNLTAQNMSTHPQQQLLLHSNMTRNTLHALSATPKPKYTDGWVQVQNRKSFDSNLSSDPAWLSAYQQKRKSMPDPCHYSHNNNNNISSNNHWLVQEAEQRRLIEQQQQRRSNNAPLQQQNGSAVKTSSVACNGKPLPDSIIQTLTERVQSKGIGERKRFDNFNSSDKSPLHAAASYQHSHPSQQQQQQKLMLSHAANNHHSTSAITTSATSATTPDKVLSVSGKKKCSHCGDELGRGAAMIIESLLLFYHINCFKCCVCHVQLGDGLNGTDVRVRNHKLHCQNCYSSDDGIKFSCV